ncbi:hypothetical protein DSO57_1005761 [Entomophthora muscae]|uniref:Uncharacterized protein n=1 Tax=Entomophthora muscae TaxID=34485 RepID=A0ACC2U6D0_9FUNG|nr:hypothetical protein DSO57_1005761 [Entomophthora muscae]
MEPPVTPKPMPASSPDLPTNHTSKLFGIVYITLTGMVDIIVPAAGPWSWLLSCGGPFLQKPQPKLPPETVGQPPETGSLTVSQHLLIASSNCSFPCDNVGTC